MNLSSNHVIPLFRWLGKPFFYSTVIWSITNYNGYYTIYMVEYFGSKMCNLLCILHQKSNCIYLIQDRPTVNMAGWWHDSIEIIKKDFEQQQQATVVPISSKVACPTLSSQVVFYSFSITKSSSGDCKRRQEQGGGINGGTNKSTTSPMMIMMRELTKRHWIHSKKICNPIAQFIRSAKVSNAVILTLKQCLL